MRAIIAVLLLGLAAGVTPALAEHPNESDNGRFTFKEVPDGILRLDGRTGNQSQKEHGSDRAHVSPPRRTLNPLAAPAKLHGRCDAGRESPSA